MFDRFSDDLVDGWVRSLRMHSERAGNGFADRPAVGPSSSRPSFVRRARAIVESRLDRAEFGVSDLAQALRISTRHLQRRLQEEAGQSPSAFIRTIRLERARSLIEDGCHSVTEAARAVQISSLSYFARCFREEFGLNPSEIGESPAPERDPAEGRSRDLSR